MLYLTVFIKSLKQQMMYRSEFLLSSAGALFFIFVQVAVWQALLAQDAVASRLSINAMTTYIIVAYILRRAQRMSFSVAFTDKVNQGSIAIDLIRPVNLKNMMISEQLSENLCVILFTCLPVSIIAGFIWGFEFAATPEFLAMFVAAVIFAVALSLYVEYIFGLLVFWIRNENYAKQLLQGLAVIFSGTAVPLWFYPDWLRAAAYFLPFSLMAFEPIQIFLGTVDTTGALTILARQAIWLFVLWVIERFVWSRIKNNIFVQGG